MAISDDISGARPPWPASDSDFESLMEWVDAGLRRNNVPFEMRSLAALSIIAREYRVEPPGWCEDRDPRPGEYSGVDLTIRVVRWIDDRYGARQRMDLRPGRTVVLIRGDVWEAWLPRMLGSHVLFASATQPSDDIAAGQVDSGSPARYNVLDSITDLAPGLRRSLVPLETREILANFTSAFEDYYLIEQVRGLELARQARHDYDATVHHLLAGANGQARWSALQAAEKMLKAFIADAGEAYPRRGHLLSPVAVKAVELGMGEIPSTLLAAAQCDPAVRYGELRASRDEAVAAHYASLDIGAHVASYIA